MPDKKFTTLANWFEIPTSKLSRAKAFYEAIFGIKMELLAFPNGLEMALFPVEEGAAGGALAYHPKAYFPGQQGPLLYLDANPDLTETLSRVVDAGGKILVPKTLISPEQGYMGLFEDTEGNRVGLRSKK